MFAILLGVYSISGHGQTFYRAGAIPSIKLSKDLQKNWAVNLAWESRHVLLRGIYGDEMNTGYDYLLSDLSLLASKKAGFRSTFAAGYLLRITEEFLIHRSIQQFTIITKPGAYRISHRFAADQSFSAAIAPEYRFRYRITMEFPLSGAEIDQREFYIKAGNEYLLSLQGGDVDLEIRLAPLLGFKVTDRNKIEAGVDYRMDALFNKIIRTSYWFSVGWYVKI